MLQLNPDVKLGISPEIVLALLVADGVYADLAGAECVVTSGTEGLHQAGSLHYAGQAVDLRVRHVARDRWEGLRDALAGRLGPDYDVLLEVEPPHLHVEYDPPLESST